ncbi:hypothetical protein [Providencia rettgeri]|uniref:Uncharacterized protein n=1 Tax=Providencia rettgeri TaxID=587 RepID=A0AAE2ZES1_PRORE|nr:hypothetical protein [Providencia rettgeri]MBW3118692.1 hypothetical protein [Providencia rettgeri]
MPTPAPFYADAWRKGQGCKLPTGAAPDKPLNVVKLKGRLAVRYSRRKSGCVIFSDCVVNLSPSPSARA